MPSFASFDSHDNLLTGDRLLFTKKETAALLSIGMRFLNYCIAAGMVRTVKKGRSVRISRSEVVRFARISHDSPLRETRRLRRPHDNDTTNNHSTRRLEKEVRNGQRPERTAEPGPQTDETP